MGRPLRVGDRVISLHTNGYRQHGDILEIVEVGRGSDKIGITYKNITSPEKTSFLDLPWTENLETFKLIAIKRNLPEWL